ncbi:MAG: hypothetical protein ABJA35_07150 [Parafilimonas sp.]
MITIVLMNDANAQTEVEAWGNLKGIRIDGQLMNFESSIDVINADWSKINATGKEKQHPNYIRDANKQIITTKLDSFYITEQIEDISEGVSKINIQFTAKKDTTVSGLFFDLILPVEDFAKSNLQLINPKQNALPTYNIAKQKDSFSVAATGIKITAPQHQLEFDFDSTTTLVIKKNDNDQYIHILIPIKSGGFVNGETCEKLFTIKASGAIDKTSITVQLDPSKKGRAFAGFGGNFRLQNPKLDPQVIDYCLDNMRVAYARVEMPWMMWQPVENSNPIDSAKAGQINPHVKASMEMAQRLSKMNFPIILTAWFPPQLAVTGELHFRHQQGEAWGNPIDSTKAQEIYKSIADYILYLKDVYQVDVKLFSFNESDLGINIRQTGEEHATLIKGLGAYFASHGLQTKMLLGDNSDATTFDFILPAMKDSETYPYIGAISFHSWRGWDTDILNKWADAATQMHLPLIVGEGSIDAAAWNYPQIFLEQTYALEEINLYVRLLNICQPLSILQWQLTADYSPLKGGGIFDNDDSLQPTQRFWNLKQLASVPENVSAIAVTVDRPNITCAAQADAGRNIYVVHLVNNGAARMVTIKGLPSQVKKIIIHTTSKTKNMEEEKPVAVVNGQAKFLLDAVSYTTVSSE